MKFGFVLGLLVTAGFAQAIQTGIGGLPEFTQTLKGNFVAAGTSTRVLEGAPQINPFQVTVAGIPNGSTIVRAYANWSYLTNFDDNNSDGTVKINGTEVRGVRSGFGDPDLNWNRTFGMSYTQDITAIVTAAGGNGAYTIRDAIDEGATQSLGEGFSMIVVYSNNNESLRQVNIDFGYTSTTSGNGNGEIQFGQGAYQGGETRFFLNALDGQRGYADDLEINAIPASAFLPLAPGDAWRGGTGPGTVGRNYYDLLLADTQGFMGIGNTSLTWRTIGGGNGDPNFYEDCIGHSVVAISMTVPEPSTLMSLAVVGIGLARFRRKAKRNRS